MGPCATPPEGIYAFGEIGIGTCLAGPTDLTFFEQDGSTWLAVSNSNPSLIFETGSVLLIDWSSVDLGRDENLLHELDAHALPIESFLGGVAYHADELKEILLVPGRLSEGSRTVAAEDHLYVVDVKDPTSPTRFALGDALEVEQDPGPVAVDPATGRVFVANTTAGTVSVVDASGAPVEVIDVAPAARVGPARFYDVDDSGSRAELALEIGVRSAVPDEQWTLTWVEGFQRLWVPHDGGLERWDHGGDTYYDPAWDTELHPDVFEAIEEVSGPFSQRPHLYFADRGDILRAVQTTAGNWLFEAPTRTPLVDEPEQLDAPSVVLTAGATFLYYDSREAVGDPASIGVSIADDIGVRATETVLVPEAPWTSLEDPYAVLDGLVHRYRMWLSLWDGEAWRIGLSESEDGLSWSAPVVVLELPGEDAAAPALAYTNGHYRMWFARGDGASWSIAEAWSYDGVTWHEVTDAVPVEGPYDRTDPPRPAVDSDVTGAFSVEAASLQVTGVAPPGTFSTLGNVGILARPATGFLLTGSDLGPSAVNGVLPSDLVEIGDDEILYVTTVDGAGQRAIGAFLREEEAWVPLGEELVSPGEAPVVHATGEGYAMYYAAPRGDGAMTLRRATSTDGVTWEPADLVVPEPADWESVRRQPHDLQLTGDGLRLWYAGSNGERARIGSMTSTDGVTFVAEPGPVDPWQLGAGTAGTFDDSGVKDPVVREVDGTLHLWYAGFDGEAWAIGHATRPVGSGTFTRTLDPVVDLPAPVLAGSAQSFSDDGVESPLILGSGAAVEALYAGFDGAVHRIGRATGGLDRLVPTQRFPTAFDTFRFDSARGESGASAIELTQQIDGFTIHYGVGGGVSGGATISSLRMDPERGFLYVVGRQVQSAANYVAVVDVRDDTGPGFVDSNYLDVEAVLEVSQIIGSSSFRDVVVVPGADLLYASGQEPDALVVFDLSLLEDDADKQVLHEAALAAIPVRRIPSEGLERPFQDEEVGENTVERISGAGLAVTPDGRHVLLSQFRENAVVVFDRALGPYGEEIRRIDGVGENPYRIALSPDGRHAVVANYLGEVEGEVVSSSLAVIDVDPGSETYLQVLTHLRNR